MGSISILSTNSPVMRKISRPSFEPWVAGCEARTLSIVLRGPPGQPVFKYLTSGGLEAATILPSPIIQLWSQSVYVHQSSQATASHIALPYQVCFKACQCNLWLSIWNYDLNPDPLICFSILLYIADHVGIIFELRLRLLWLLSSLFND